MKTSEIQIGAEYAYAEWPHSTPEKVTVLRVGVQGNASQFRRTVHTNLVEVEHRIWGKSLVRPQKIIRTWKAEKAERREASRARKEQERMAADIRANRARVAFSLHEMLLRGGAEIPEPEVIDGETFDADLPMVFDDEDLAALKAAGFETADSVYGSTDSVKTPLHDIDDLMSKGVVPLDIVANLLGFVGVEV